jgi:N-methylhydantoinase A
MIVVPTYSSVFSAFGIAGSDLVNVRQASDPMSAPFDLKRLNALYRRLEADALDDLAANGVSPEGAATVREIEMRYRGQVHEVRVPVPPGDLDDAALGVVLTDFRRRYDRRYGRGAALEGAGVEARTFLVRGVGSVVKPQLRPHPLEGSDPQAGRVGERSVYFRERQGFAPTPIYRREGLRAGNVVAGPAVVEAIDTTVVVRPGQSVRVDEWGNLLFEAAP